MGSSLNELEERREVVARKVELGENEIKKKKKRRVWGLL